jgi:hypothetical protein
MAISGGAKNVSYGRESQPKQTRKRNNHTVMCNSSAENAHAYGIDIGGKRGNSKSKVMLNERKSVISQQQSTQESAFNKKYNQLKHKNSVVRSQIDHKFLMSTLDNERDTLLSKSQIMDHSSNE